MVPKALKKENLPKPNQKAIEFTEVPAKRVAAITFGGWANSEKIEKNKQKLIQYLAAENISHSNRFFFLGYNAPFEMVGRKNDIIVELD
ncbi:MAG: heme-binding protein [Putridiphycobacter sp.]|nr:heme-binding protein [Putridiphycobacter sp.]